MGVDWGLAGQIGGFGFGLVFAVLVVLALAVWLLGLLLNRINSNSGKASSGKKGE